MKKSILISIATLLLTYAGAKPATAPAQETARVKGKVTTLIGGSEAVVTDVKISFLSGARKFEVSTDALGNYDIQLPDGTYQISTNSPGFCSYTHAPFRVDSSTLVLMNAILYVCPLSNILKFDDKGKFVGEECRYQDQFTSETSLGLNLSNEYPRPLIRYGKRQDKQDSFEYEGVTINNGEHLGAMASYDTLTLYADKIRFYKASLILEAEGHVLLEDGKHQSRWRKVEIDFKAKEPISTLTKR